MSQVTRPPADSAGRRARKGSADRAGAIGGLAPAPSHLRAGFSRHEHHVSRTDGHTVFMSATRFSTVSFLSDLGLGSEHVGVVKAVIREEAPHVAVIDLTHDIAPFDVRAASLALARAVPYLTEGVVIACVDPGAGSDRRLIGVEVADGAGVFLGPDNGLLAPGVALVGGAGRAVVLDRDEHHLSSPGSTFAARDVLAPVAAALCNGIDLFDLGTPIDSGMLLPGVVPIPREENGGLSCEVLWVDRFGNCQLNVSLDDVRTVLGADVTRVRTTIGTDVRSFEVVTAFDSLGAGAAGLVVDSAGLLCIAVGRASAANELSVGEGDQVFLSPGGEPAPASVSVTISPSR
jgi:S-adenosylmethionine hydrolase